MTYETHIWSRYVPLIQSINISSLINSEYLPLVGDDMHLAFSSSLKDLIAGEYGSSFTKIVVDNEGDQNTLIINMHIRRHVHIMDNGLHQIILEGFSILGNAQVLFHNHHMLNNANVMQPHHTITGHCMERHSVLERNINNTRWNSTMVWRIICLTRALICEVDNVKMDATGWSYHDPEHQQKLSIGHNINAIAIFAHSIMAQCSIILKELCMVIYNKKEEERKWSSQVIEGSMWSVINACNELFKNLNEIVTDSLTW
jgi:hypothetical protein